MNSWVNQAGYPVVLMTTDKNKTQIEMSQDNFFFQNKTVNATNDVRYGNDIWKNLILTISFPTFCNFNFFFENETGLFVPKTKWTNLSNWIFQEFHWAMAAIKTFLWFSCYPFILNRPTEWKIPIAMQKSNTEKVTKYMLTENKGKALLSSV